MEVPPPREFFTLNLERWNSEPPQGIERLERFGTGGSIDCHDHGFPDPSLSIVGIPSSQTEEPDSCGDCVKLLTAVSCDYESDSRLLWPLRQAH